MFIRFSFAHEETTLVNHPIISKDAVLEYVHTPEKKRDKKKKYGSFATKRGENCVKVVLVQFLSIIMPEIASTERNAKFQRKDTQPLCMVIKQIKIRLSSRMTTL